jgi:hypothetical protein
MSVTYVDSVISLDWEVTDGAWIEIPQSRPQMRLLGDSVDLAEDVAFDQLRTARFVQYTGDFDVF